MFSVAFTVFLTSYAIGWIGTYYVGKLSKRIGFVDLPGGRKIHENPIPLGGGVAIFLATLAPVVLGYGLVHVDPTRLPGQALPWIQTTILQYMDKLPLLKWQLLIMWGVAAVYLVVGLLDDRYDLSPYLRLFIQIAGATAMYVLSYVVAGAGGEVKLAAPIFRHIPVLQGVITVLWIVGLMNAFNFLDNMDGMCSGVALVISAVLFSVAVQTGQPMIAASLVAFMGALVGFLLFNFPPARVFMGDAGSTFVGYFMALMSMGVTFLQRAPSGFKEPSVFVSVIVPILVMIIPIYDVASVVLIRIRKGQSPFRPDENHFSHRLIKLLDKKWRVLVTVYLIVFAIGIAATLMPQLEGIWWGQAVIIVQAVVILSLITLLEIAGERVARKKRLSSDDEREQE